MVTDKYNNTNELAVQPVGRQKGSKNKKRLPVFVMPERQRLMNPNPSATEIIANSRAKAVAYTLSLSRWPKIDLFNPRKLKNRIDAFFHYSMTAEIIPTLPSFCVALGIDKVQLHQIRTQTFYRDKTYYNLPKECVEEIRRGYDMLAQTLETAILQGLVNNIGGIFIAKNNFEYKDEANYTITPGREKTDTEEIMRRYKVESDSQDD